LLDGQELPLGKLHVLLERFSLYSFITGKLRIELFDADRCVEPYDKEGLIAEFEEVGDIGVFSKVLAEVFVAGLGVEELLDAPHADLVRGALPHDLPL
jgi:hypothetical protein